MVKIAKINYRDLVNDFGNPETQEGLEKIRKSQVRIRLPFRFNGGKTQEIYCHGFCASAYLDALKEILSTYGSEKEIQRLNLDVFSGCHVERKIKTADGSDSPWWSVHTWGMAFDHNPHLGPFNKKSVMPYHFVKSFLDRGFYWGGKWKNQDGMHFSCING